jgi:UDP-N-acetyl-D-galactosamine dehydrogenase
MPTIGYDLSSTKIASCRQHIDPSGTVGALDLRAAAQLTFTTDATMPIVQ